MITLKSFYCLYNFKASEIETQTAETQERQVEVAKIFNDIQTKVEKHISDQIAKNNIKNYLEMADQLRNKKIQDIFGLSSTECNIWYLFSNPDKKNCFQINIANNQFSGCFSDFLNQYKQNIINKLELEYTQELGAQAKTIEDTFMTMFTFMPPLVFNGKQIMRSINRKNSERNAFRNLILEKTKISSDFTEEIYKEFVQCVWYLLLQQELLLSDSSLEINKKNNNIKSIQAIGITEDDYADNLLSQNNDQTDPACQKVVFFIKTNKGINIQVTQNEIKINQQDLFVALQEKQEKQQIMEGLVKFLMLDLKNPYYDVASQICAESGLYQKTFGSNNIAQFLRENLKILKKTTTNEGLNNLIEKLCEEIESTPEKQINIKVSKNFVGSFSLKLANQGGLIASIFIKQQSNDLVVRGNIDAYIDQEMSAVFADAIFDFLRENDNPNQENTNPNQENDQDYQKYIESFTKMFDELQNKTIYFNYEDVLQNMEKVDQNDKFNLNTIRMMIDGMDQIQLTKDGADMFFYFKSKNHNFKKQYIINPSNIATQKTFIQLFFPILKEEQKNLSKNFQLSNLNTNEPLFDQLFVLQNTYAKKKIKTNNLYFFNSFEDATFEINCDGKNQIITIYNKSKKIYIILEGESKKFRLYDPLYEHDGYVDELKESSPDDKKILDSLIDIYRQNTSDAIDHRTITDLEMQTISTELDKLLVQLEQNQALKDLGDNMFFCHSLYQEQYFCMKELIGRLERIKQYWKEKDELNFKTTKSKIKQIQEKYENILENIIDNIAEKVSKYFTSKSSNIQSNDQIFTNLEAFQERYKLSMIGDKYEEESEEGYQQRKMDAIKDDGNGNIKCVLIIDFIYKNHRFNYSKFLGLNQYGYRYIDYNYGERHIRNTSEEFPPHKSFKDLQQAILKKTMEKMLAQNNQIAAGILSEQTAEIYNRIKQQALNKNQCIDIRSQTNAEEQILMEKNMSSQYVKRILPIESLKSDLINQYDHSINQIVIEIMKSKLIDKYKTAETPKPSLQQYIQANLNICLFNSKHNTGQQFIQNNIFYLPVKFNNKSISTFSKNLITIKENSDLPDTKQILFDNDVIKKTGTTTTIVESNTEDYATFQKMNTDFQKLQQDLCKFVYDSITPEEHQSLQNDLNKPQQLEKQQGTNVFFVLGVAGVGGVFVLFIAINMNKNTTTQSIRIDVKKTHRAQIRAH